MKRPIFTGFVGFDDESSSVKSRRELRGLFALLRINTALLPIPFIDEDTPRLAQFLHGSFSFPFVGC